MPQDLPSPRAGTTGHVPAVPARGPAHTAAPPALRAPRRIVFLARRDLANPAAGGSELLVDRLAQGLTAHGHQVTLLCGGPTAERDYRVISAGSDISHFLKARHTFTRQIGDCDLLVEVCNGMPYLAPLWHNGPTLCLVNHVHSDLWHLRYPRPLASLGRRLEHFALARAHRHNLIVAMSASTATALDHVGVDPERIRIVHSGVEEPGPLLPKSPQPLFVAVGRLVEYKRIDLLLRLWDLVRPVTGGHLVIIGDGPERTRLQTIAGDGVIFTGRISEQAKHRLLCQAWLLLHPSLVEGWGLVVTEAATRHTPAIGFDIPGLRDSITHNVTGHLTTGESSFAAAWCTLTLNHQHRTTLATNAAQHAAQHRWNHTVHHFRTAATEAYTTHQAGR